MIRNLASGCPDESSLSHKPAAVGVRGCARSELEDAAAMTSTALTIAIARDPKHMVHSHFIRQCVVPYRCRALMIRRRAHLRWVWFRRAGGAFPAGRHQSAYVQMPHQICHGADCQDASESRNRLLG